MKKVDILTAYALVNGAKLTKLEDEAKFKVIKACKAMKPIVEELEAFEKDAREKLKGEKHEEYLKLAQKWQEEGEKTTLTIEERKELNEYFGEYNKKVQACVNDEFESEVTLDYERLTSDEVKKLVSSNDWNVAQTIAVMAVVE